MLPEHPPFKIHNLDLRISHFVLIFALVNCLVHNSVMESDFQEPLNPITTKPSSTKLNS